MKEILQIRAENLHGKQLCKKSFKKQIKVENDVDFFIKMWYNF